MARLVSIYLPRWPIDRIARRYRLPLPSGGARRRKPAGPALLVVTSQHQQQVVMQGCRRCDEAGVRPGMTVANARALLKTPHVEMFPHEPEKDADALTRLARWSERWTPIASADPPDGLVLDITGCTHLFGGEAAMLAVIADDCTRLRFSVRIAAAPTIGTAWAAARFGPSPLTSVADGREREALADLPIRALRVDDAIEQALSDIGVRRIDQLLALPRSSLPARYGHDLTRRIDQALGERPETIFSAAPDITFAAFMDLPGGTTQWEAVAGATRIALEDLTRQLARQNAGVRRLEALYERLDGESVTLIVQVSRPTQCPKHLWGLLGPKVERLDMGFGVEAITLNARITARLSHQQQALVHNAIIPIGDDRDVAETLDTIANRLGSDRVWRPLLQASRTPERAFVLLPATVNEPVMADEAVILGRPRPSRLFDPPECATVIAMSPDGPIHRVRWRGRDHAIVHCSEPERIGGEWWRRREPARDYFQVQDDQGRRLWVFHEIASQPHRGWCVHGEWA